MQLHHGLLRGALFLSGALFFTGATAPLAQPIAAAVASGDKDKSAEDDEPPEPPAPVTTQHEITLGGELVRYSATVGALRVREDGDEAKADMFFVAYQREGVESAQRPVMFTFNGGPGSSSVWLHMGAFGPRWVAMPENGERPKPPFDLQDNEHSILAHTDLVFIDPVTTGYSRPVEGQKGGQFHGVREDVRWIGEFIRLWTTRYERWDSPKFLAGESYGTTRAAALAQYMESRLGWYPSGVILVSSILSFQTARFDAGNDLPYPLFLPTYTATAWFHGQLAPDLQQDLRATLDEAEAFALGDYSRALMLGDRLGAEDESRVVTQLARLTGLSPEYVRATNLRPVIHRFTKELLRAERTTVGRLDSRYTGSDPDAAGEHTSYDPSYAAIQGVYTAALNHYLRTELDYHHDVPYEILSGRVHPWKWNDGNAYVDTSHDLAGAMSRNPHLSVFVANGYYDLATPYFATEYTIAHMGLAPELRERIEMQYYEAGHMMYVHEPSLADLGRDVGDFIQRAGN